MLQIRAAGTQCLTAFITDQLEVRNDGVLLTRAVGTQCLSAFIADQLDIRDDGVLQRRSAGTYCLTACIADHLEFRIDGVLQTRAFRHSMPDDLPRSPPADLCDEQVQKKRGCKR